MYLIRHMVYSGLPSRGVAACLSYSCHIGVCVHANMTDTEHSIDYNHNYNFKVTGGTEPLWAYCE